MHTNRTAFIALALCSLFTGVAIGQTSTTDPVGAPGQRVIIPIAPAVPAAQPSYIVAFGGGFTQASDPHYAATGTFGVRIADGSYSLTSLDMSTKAVAGLAGTVHRVSVSTIRTGAEKILLQSGPFTLTAHADGGLSLGNGSTVGQVSGGGTLAFDIPKHPNLFVYLTSRILKSPQSDPSVVDPAVVQTAFSFGIGIKLFPQK